MRFSPAFLAALFLSAAACGGESPGETASIQAPSAGAGGASGAGAAGAGQGGAAGQPGAGQAGGGQAGLSGSSGQAGGGQAGGGQAGGGQSGSSAAGGGQSGGAGSSGGGQAGGCDLTPCEPPGDPCHQSYCDPGSGLCVIKDADGECDDGDACTELDYCLVGVCVGYQIDGCCQGSCAGKTCGDNGCGQSCGACGAGEVCGDKGACVPATVGGEGCADAVVILGLPYKVTGSTTGHVNDLEVPPDACLSGPLGSYGGDVVYRYTAATDGVVQVALTGLDYEASVYLTTDCADLKYSCVGGSYSVQNLDVGPIPVTMKKGETYFIVVDGNNEGTYTLSLNGCVPACEGKECGQDGCGQSCGQCPSFAYECSTAGQCVCLPDCAGKVCGDNGCGQSCGACEGGATCDGAGQCVQGGQPGDTCQSAIPVLTSPFSYQGNTKGFGNDATAWWACDGNGSGAYLGDEAPDVIFALSPAKPTTYYAELTGQGFIPALYAVHDCGNILSCIQTQYQAASLKNLLFFEVQPENPAFVVVDAYSSGGGPFTLDIRACDAPGACPGGEQGDTCSYATPVNSLPFVDNKLGSYLDNYHLDPGGPCGAPKVVGEGSAEQVYAFTPSQSGQVQLKASGQSGFDAVLYVTTDCGDLTAHCLAWSDQAGENEDEVLSFEVVAGKTYYLVVDGASPFGSPGQVTLSALAPQGI